VIVVMNATGFAMKLLALLLALPFLRKLGKQTLIQTYRTWVVLYGSTATYHSRVVSKPGMRCLITRPGLSRK
jgi:hypothetical protein